MIKCNVTVCGVIGRDASVRKNKEEKEFLVFPLRVQIPATGGGHTIEVDVRKEGCQEEAAGYRNGSRVEVRGSEGYDVSQTPGRQAIFQPVRR